MGHNLVLFTLNTAQERALVADKSAENLSYDDAERMASSP
jgi:hypothetical protein